MYLDDILPNESLFNFNDSFLYVVQFQFWFTVDNVIYEKTI